MDKLDRNAARKLISAILNHGSVVIWGHCRDAMEDRAMTTVDLDNVLRCGTIPDDAEFESDEWRYRVHTAKMCAVIQFEDETELSVVTAWKKKGR